MNEPSKDWLSLVGQMVTEVEQFCTTVVQEFETTCTVLGDLSQQCVAELETAIHSELDEWDQDLNAWVDSVLDLLFDVDQATQETTMPLHQIFDPILSEHPACVGCQHYHGQVYNQVPFICAMHPYGWETDHDCPDWESMN